MREHHVARNVHRGDARQVQPPVGRRLERDVRVVGQRRDAASVGAAHRGRHVHDLTDDRRLAALEEALSGNIPLDEAFGIGDEGEMTSSSRTTWRSPSRIFSR
jgi:hypothetical protein